MTNVDVHECALYLVIDADPPASDRLRAILEAIFVPTVLIKSSTADLDAATAQPLIEIAQQFGTAALIADDPQLARTLRADGCHLGAASDIAAKYDEARDILGTRYIIGASAGKSRDDAMHLGEAGADYIAFGAPPHLQDREKATATRRMLIDWWADLFEIPCVAFDVTTKDVATELASLGADFVSLAIPQGMTAADAVDNVRDFTRVLGSIEPEASR